jgi:hypothetical protein
MQGPIPSQLFQFIGETESKELPKRPSLLFSGNFLLSEQVQGPWRAPLVLSPEEGRRQGGPLHKSEKVKIHHEKHFKGSQKKENLKRQKLSKDLF